MLHIRRPVGKECALQAQLVGAAERNRPELLEYLEEYYSLVVMTTTCCLDGPGG